MGLIDTIGPYRFYFYEGEADEPPHVHVSRDRDEAKFWLDPVAVAYNRRFNEPELRKLTRLVRKHARTFTDAWNNRPGPGSA
ncbi:DUF4160 domain-containing protein [Rubrivirga sp.]|uniref:DUF4160 domain-containing protein n=1 Tax=Rubrivirga sp. TaxID=1885344 RepID=UPI003B524BC6